VSISCLAAVISLVAIICKERADTIKKARLQVNLDDMLSEALKAKDSLNNNNLDPETERPLNNEDKNNGGAKPNSAEIDGKSERPMATDEADQEEQK